ncbi:VOC family protein [Chloroflexus aurantiacus]
MAACGDHSWFAYLNVSDAAELYAEYTSAGVPIWHELSDKPWGFREFGVVTPDGHKSSSGRTWSNDGPTRPDYSLKRTDQSLRNGSVCLVHAFGASGFR